MNTEFRGKRVDNGEWVYGSLINTPSARNNFKATIIDKEANLWYTLPNKELHIDKDSWNVVIPETIGQYTERKDKNDKKIYCGDIVIANLKYFDIKNEKCKIIFKDGSFGVQYGYSDDYFKPFGAWDNLEIIGNIHEIK